MKKKPKIKKKESSTNWQGTVLPDDACPSCGSMMKETEGELSQPVNGENITVSNAAHLHCPHCHEVVLRLDEARHLQEAALSQYRKKYELLSADEIRSIRERYGLTQKALARILRLGSNTLSRWESGRNVQTAAMDVLLRLLRDLPASLNYLKRNAA